LAAVAAAVPGPAWRAALTRPVGASRRPFFQEEIFVVIAAVLIVLEFRARQGYTRTVEEFDQAWQAAQQEGKGVYREDLDKLIHGGPSRELDQKRGMETFTWRGLRTYRLEVQYGDVGFVTSFQAFQPEQ
jgi:hypothetical protein